MDSQEILKIAIIVIIFGVLGVLNAKLRYYIRLKFAESHVKNSRKAGWILISIFVAIALVLIVLAATGAYVYKSS